MTNATISGRKVFRMCLMALLALSLFRASVPLRAQDQPPAAQKRKEAQEPEQGPGFGRQLAQETREAAGEEEEKDDKAVFKRSPSVNYIAKKLGISTETASIFSFLFNFAVIAGILGWATRKYLPGAFSARTLSIQKAMQEAQKASEEARRRLAEIESRLMKLDVEIGMMRDAAEKEAVAEEARIRASAQEDAQKMLESAQQEIASAAKAARRELMAYAADLAVGLAQKQIRVDAKTDQALIRNFSGQLGTSSAGSGNGPGKDDH